MDAQGRGRADDIDPADQWVLNPNTGDYELRLQSSAPQSTVPGPRRTATRAGGAATRPRTAPGRDREVPGTDVPGPRRRRGAPEEPPPGRRRTKPKKSRAKKILLWTGGGMALVLVGVSAAAYAYIKHLEGNVATTDVGSAGASSFSKDEAFNILIIGTDKRTGAGNEGYGDKGSVGHADTNILLHVSKDRTNATAMSIPRDLMVDIPDCPTKQEDGVEKIVPGTLNQRFNTSLGQGGRNAGCTMRTVEAVTGIKPDHFMMADFNAVKTLTTAVDGVEVCVEKAVDDKESKLKLLYRYVQGRGRAGAGLRADPAQLRQPGRPRPHQGAAAVPGFADAQDGVQRHPHQPEQAAEARRGRHQGTDGGHRHRKGQHAQGRGAGAEEGAAEEHLLHDGPGGGQPGREGQGDSRRRRVARAPGLPDDQE